MQILFILILVPFVEIFTFIEVGKEIGAIPAIAITILSAIIGLYIVRKESDKEQLKALHKMQEGGIPIKESLSSLCLLFAGVLLLIPGLVTDFLGALLLIPFMRTLFIKKVISNIEKRINKQAAHAESVQITINGKRMKHKHNDEVIDGMFTEKNHHNDN